MRWFTAVPSWMIPLWVNVKSWWLRLRGWDFYLVTWVAECPKCSQSLAYVPVTNGVIYDGREVTCGCCGHHGVVEVLGQEEFDVAWEEVEHDQA